MSDSILIIGRSGTGKSRSVMTLDPATTFIINVNGKTLPMKGARNNYTPFSKDNLEGNMLNSDNPQTILKTLEYINTKRPEIKTVVIDDYQYVMANEYMRRAGEIGFKKFVDIGQNAWTLVTATNSLRDDLICVFMMHSDTDMDSDGNRITKAKTIGKMLDNVITFEGMFSIVLYTDIENVQDKLNYRFCTQNNGTNTAKSPEGMFDYYIPNDLSFVIDRMIAYYDVSK